MATERAGSCSAPLTLCRLDTWAPSHQRRGGALAHRAAVGAGRDRGRTPHRRPCRRGTRGRMGHRQQRGLAEGKRRLINDPTRFECVKVIGVDEHVWRHTRRSDKYVTVIIDLTPVRDGAGPARLLDMVEGRSKAAFKTWLADRDDAFRDAVEVVAMDGFTGFKTAAAEEIPDAVTVMDPFHVVRLAGDALDRCRRRVQLAIHGHRGFRDDPLYKSRRTLHTGADLLTDKQSDRLRALFVDDVHVEVEATWGAYQRMIAAYRHEDRQRGRELMEKLITDLSAGSPRCSPSSPPWAGP
ncbi:ISL3 family transposase [Janibacter alkaliphilus]|uniref:ISL3 family transposase n=1 Tax=Janibacter alkaliphilus TaxID=1069963 RepID=UPI0024839AF7|nr:ISL3 family transposase [Janibacter alkaliphilus]